MNVIITEDNKYSITFPFDFETIEFVKRLQGARYHPATKHWTAARNVPNAIDLRNYGSFNDEMILKVDDSYQPELRYTWKINASLYQHQRQWADWCVKKPRALLVAEMGLGKTLMAMQWMKAHGIPPREVIIIAPTSLLLHWQKELQAFAGEDSIPITGTKKQRSISIGKTGIHIVNYEYVTGTGKKADLREELKSLVTEKTAIILDESHRVKNPMAKRSKVLHTLCFRMPNVLLLTGTPVSQGAQDYFSQFKCILPGLLGATFTAFRTRYCREMQIAGAPRGISRIIGYKNMDELTELIKPYTYNILKKDHLPDLPEKIFTQRYVELTAQQRKHYHNLKEEMLTWLDGNEDGEPVTAPNILTRMLRLSQITQGFLQDPETGKFTDIGNSKLDALKEQLEDWENEPCVVICRYRYDIQAIQTLLEKQKREYFLIDGSVPTAERQEAVDQFQSSKKPSVMIGQIQTIGLGFTLTRASKMIFYSNSYSLTDRLQAEDRIHRIGAAGEHCLYVDIIANDTVDEQIVKALRGKVDVANMLTEMRMLKNVLQS